MTQDDVAALVDDIRTGVGTVIVGQQDLVETVILAVLCEGHVLLEGVPGLGKTRLLQTLGSVLDVDFGRIQFTPDLMPADIVGTTVMRDGEFAFHEGPIFHNLVLADEINRATPRTQSALLEAMQERSVTTAGVTRPLPRPFFVMATQNPIEMEGTYPLPEAQLDRFLFKALVGAPSSEDMVEILRRTTTGSESEPNAVVDGVRLRAMAAMVRDLPIGSHLLHHVAELVSATHPGSETAPERIRRYVRFGASPRGAQALVLGAKALALIDGRPNVAADDIHRVASAALRHRLVLGYDALVDGVSADDLVADLLADLPAPRMS